MHAPIFSVVDAVAVLNQTLSTVYPSMTIVGELDSFKVAKGRWVYADLKDEYAKLRLFGTVYQLPGPLEDGMMVEITAEPRVHPQFGFSLNLQSIRPVGEGSLKKAADKLEAKLTKEGLFAEERKRPVPYPPETIALVTADRSAAQADFMKIAAARWPLASITFYQTSVQGNQAPEEIVQALHRANESSADVVVLIRGGGSADDLAAFSDERVVRAVAASRLPSVVAIGHEIDISLAERAADMAASTPSNAAELLLPDRREVLRTLKDRRAALQGYATAMLQDESNELEAIRDRVSELAARWVQQEQTETTHALRRLDSYHPKHTLARGYALVHRNGKMLKAAEKLRVGDTIEIERAKQTASAVVKETRT